jgi:hypothetical protein
VGPNAFAADDARCADGIEVYPRWQGEYPSPVVHVKELVAVPAFSHPCDPEPTGACLLQPGLFHPWGDGEAFATVRPLERFKAHRPFSLDGASIKAGEIITLVGYLAEGMCTWRVGDSEIAASCEDLQAIPVEALPTVDVQERQFFRAGCEAWVLVDDTLFARPEIETGTVESWGKVRAQTVPPPPKKPETPKRKGDPAVYEIVKKFAPVLKFDQAYKGLPMSAQVYFDTMMTPKFDLGAEAANRAADGLVTWTTPWDGPCGEAGVIKVPGRDESNCGMQNNDFQTLLDGRVPTYYNVISDEEGRLRIAYWWYYGFQKYCNPNKCDGAAGEHHGDWESIYVTTSPDRRSIDYVTYTFHGHWYTREKSKFETAEGGRPVVYVGKLAHGSYHDRTLSGWMVGTAHHCCVYADYRNPVDHTVWANTADNLVSLDDNEEPWMLADRIGSLYDHEEKKYEVTHWRWGPHVSYKGWWCKWEHVTACGTHPTVATFDWYMTSCNGDGCGTNHCKGLVYDRKARFNSPWPWTTADTEYDEPLFFVCPGAGSANVEDAYSKALSYVHSKHSNQREDRVWRFGCSSVSGRTTKCDWTEDLNEMDRPMDFNAPGNSFLVGLDSYHSNQTEDRVWKAKWCEAEGQCRSSCKWTGYVNDWDGELTLSTGNQVIAGVRSLHSDKREDRRWEFLLCDLGPCDEDRGSGPEEGEGQKSRTP